MTTDEKFRLELRGDNSLDGVIDWIKNNLKPHDVFDEDVLLEWASYELPGDVFPEWELEEWARYHDFNRE